MPADSYELLRNRLEAYFADQEDAEAVAALREELKADADLAKTLREQMDEVLSDPEFDILTFLTRYANRHCDFSENKARHWLKDARDRLFPH
ncbi:MAG: hypothetical protein AAB339_12775 [Elusimicrobiota bacterium]